MPLPIGTRYLVAPSEAESWVSVPICFQAIAANLLHDIPRSNNVANKLNDEIDRVSKFLLEETSLQEDLSLERNERQKKALLQKVTIML